MARSRIEYISDQLDRLASEARSRDVESHLFRGLSRAKEEDEEQADGVVYRSLGYDRSAEDAFGAPGEWLERVNRELDWSNNQERRAKIQDEQRAEELLHYQKVQAFTSKLETIRTDCDEEKYNVVSVFFDAIGDSARELRRNGESVYVSQEVDFESEDTSLGFRVGQRAVSNFDKLGKAVIQSKFKAKLNAPVRDPSYRYNITRVAAPANPTLEGDCPFCLEQLKAGDLFKTPCGHTSCKSCWNSWVEVRRAAGAAAVTCVMCRAPVGF